MIRQDLIDDLTAELGKQSAKHAVATVFDTIEQALIEDRLVLLHGFGRFTTHRHSARPHRNPATGEALGVRPATRYVHFRTAKSLHDAIQPVTSDV